MRKILLTGLALGLSACGSASGLPLGDQKHSSTPRVGYIESCQQSYPTQIMGAGKDGPWIDSANGTWDPTQKLAIAGNVTHQATHRIKLAGSSLFIDGNGLPSVSGTFPVSPSDPAYQYDRNPNSIKGYTLSVRLPANPKVNATPTCIGGTVGVTATGIPIFNGFDANGRDANAHELQDRCGGHPQVSGQYHFHALSKCWKDDGKPWGYALDGFGIYGPRTASGKTLTSADLDACHGITSSVKWHGHYKRIYHYVATADFPYTVGCYRGTPITSATGLAIGRPG